MDLARQLFDLSRDPDFSMEALEKLLANPMTDVNRIIKVDLAEVDGNFVLAAQNSGYLNAVVNGNLRFVDRLLRVPGIDVNAIKPLRLVMQKNATTVAARLLQDPRIDFNDDTDGYSALFLAVVWDRSEILSMLLAHPGIDLNITRHRVRDTLLFEAVRHETDTIRILKPGSRSLCLPIVIADPRVDVNQKSVKSEWTPLTYAVYHNNDVAVEELLRSPMIEVNKPSRGMSALHWAARSWHGVFSQSLDELLGQPGLLRSSNVPVFARLLVHPDINVNSIDLEGNTALHYAAEICKTALVKLLIIANADVGIRNNKGKTARTIAHDKGYYDIVVMIDKARRKSAVNIWHHARGIEPPENDDYNLVGYIVQGVAKTLGYKPEKDLLFHAHHAAHDAYVAAVAAGGDGDVHMRAKEAAKTVATSVFSAAIEAAAAFVSGGAGANHGGGRRRHYSRRAAKTNRRSTRQRGARSKHGRK